MTLDDLRHLCLSLPGTTESVKWGHNLVFSVARKMFAITHLETARVERLSFKCSPDDFAGLTEREGLRPAPYLARHSWVLVESEAALDDPEIESLVRRSYRLVVARLPRRVRTELAQERRSSPS